MENEPHVRVKFRNGAVKNKEMSVHFSFVKGFTVHTKEFDKSQPHRVFWSPDESDSPSRMLQRVRNIPSIEKNDTCSKEPGYYRASVSAIKENKLSLEEFISKKRIPTVADKSMLMKSFDASDLDSLSNQEASTSKSTTGKCHVKIEKTPKEGGKKINSKPNAPAIRKKLEALAKTTLIESAEEALFKPDVSQKKKRKGKKFSDDSSDSSGNEMMTPTKYLKLQKDIKIEQATNQRVHAINERLREKLKEVEAERDKLKNEFAGTSQHSKLFDVSPNKDGLTETSQDSVMSKSTLITKRNLPSIAADTSQHSDFFDVSPSPNKDCFNETSLDSVTGKATHITNFNLSPTPSKHSTEGETELGLGGNDHQSSSTLQRQIADLGNDAPSANGISADGLSYQLFPGKVLEKDLFNLFLKIKPGTKGDLRLIKNAAVFLFGAETLASSTVRGTKRGNKKGNRDAGDDVKKPAALNPKLLDALNDFLKWRVDDEEVKKPALNPKDKVLTYLERLDSKRVDGAIRDKQKRLREIGYGTGDKSKEFDKEEFEKEF